MSSNLPPIEVSEEAKTYEKNIEFTRCLHKQAVYDRTKGELRCPCGVAFSGPRLSELERLLKLDRS